MIGTSRRSWVLAIPLVVLAPSSMAQPCVPAWGGTIGVPGIQDGYVGAFGVYSTAGAPSLYVGGSFTSIGNNSSIRFLARWNQQANTWSRLGAGIGSGFTNAFMTALVPFNPGTGEVLIVGGFYADAGGVAGTRSIAAWNGSVWSSLATGWTTATADSVWAMTVWNGGSGARLYVGGGFATVGGMSANGIASWDPKGWTGLGTGISGSFSPTVFSLLAFDDGSGPALYAGGRFDAVGGVSAPLVARWNGMSWSRVGAGLSPSSVFADVSAMAVFDDGSGPALYVGGSSFAPAGHPATSVAKWNGVSWSSIGQSLGGRTTTLAVFDDGSGSKLHAAGTAQPGINYIARLDGGQWVTLDGGVGGPGVPPSNFPSVFAMRVWEDRLYVGGNFTLAGAQQASGLAARTACTACGADFNNDGVLNSQDFFDFLVCFLTPGACPPGAADFNDDGDVNSQDFFDYLAAFFAGC